MHFKLTKGLDIPITGQPQQVITPGREVRSVAILGRDFVGLKPTMMVAEGERVKLGQAEIAGLENQLVEDKKNPGVQVTAPGAGIVRHIHRGEKRVLESVVIELDGDDEIVHEPIDPADVATLERETLQQRLLESGLWCAFRTRPYNKAPVAGSAPRAIFVTAIDTYPLAADPLVVLREYMEDFADMMDVEMVLINKESSIPAIKKELYWNEAYYRLNKAY